MSAEDKKDISTSSISAQLASQQEWQSDKDIKNCTNCEKLFALGRRKHHCRCCGRIFCDSCSPHKDELPAYFETKGLQRTCDSCHVNLQLIKMEDDPTSLPARPG